MTKPLPHWKATNKKVGDRVIETHVGVDQPNARAAHDEWTRALGVRDTIILEGVLNDYSRSRRDARKNRPTR